MFQNIIESPLAKEAAEAEIVTVEMTESCARDLTDRIKSAVTDVAEMLHRAHEGRAWAALGYSSWKEYCETEFSDDKATVIPVARLH